MTLPEDRPTLPERYATAIESHHLEVVEERCDVDVLIAAGWVRSSLGTDLYRLRAEYDSARGEYHQAQDNAVAAERHIRQLERSASQASAERAASLRRTIELAADEAQRAALTARALVLIHLKTLHATRQSLGTYAVAHATRERYMADDAAVGRIAGRALEAWLDPNCPCCGGRGFNGGFGSPMELCPLPPHGCGGSGKRYVRLAKGEAGHQFGRSLLNQMDRKCDIVTALMKQFLAHRARTALARKHRADAQELRDDAAWNETAAAKLRGRLIELRSAQAEED